MYLQTSTGSKFYCGPKAYLDSQNKCQRNTEYWGIDNTECIPTINSNDMWMVSIKNGCMTIDSDKGDIFTNINYETNFINP